MIFLDYDGTLSPIVKDPDAAFMPPSVRAAVDALSQKREVAIVSGRGRQKVRDFVQLDGLYYAGSHGFDIAGPNGLAHEVAADKLPILADAAAALRQKLASIPGATVEDNKFSMSVHWRNVAEELRGEVERATIEEVAARDGIRYTEGKCVYELRPDLGEASWNKGEAVLFLLDFLLDGATADDVVPVYMGDDTTDEDAFAVLQGLGGLSFLVTTTGDPERPRDTFSTHTVASYREVEQLLGALAEIE